MLIYAVFKWSAYWRLVPGQVSLLPQRPFVLSTHAQGKPQDSDQQENSPSLRRSGRATPARTFDGRDDNDSVTPRPASLFRMDPIGSSKMDKQHSIEQAV